MLIHYKQALERLSLATQEAVRVALAAMDAQVRSNVEHETALAPIDFVSLLTQFSTELGTGESPRTSWERACRAHQLKGRALAGAQCPVTLGRVKQLPDHAIDIHKASNGRLSKIKAEQLLRKHSGSPDPVGFETALRAAPLGNFTVWATFDGENTANNPFARLPATQAGICAALGLGHISNTHAIVLLEWDHVTSGSPPLHRPTIADAECNPHFSPHMNPIEVHGWTKPLAYTSTLPAQPEVVTPKLGSLGLKLPFHVIDA
jgi:hypothetical protein